MCIRPLTLKRLVPLEVSSCTSCFAQKNAGRNAEQFPIGIEPGEHDKVPVVLDGSNNKGLFFHLARGDGIGFSGVGNDADHATTTKDRSTILTAPSNARR